MIVECAVYEDGARVEGEIDLEEARRLTLGTKAFAWISVVEPDEDELAQVGRWFDLHELVVEDAVSAHQRPKLERYDGGLFLVLKSARYVDSDEVVEIGEILVFVGDGYLIAVRHGQAAAGLAQARRDLEERSDLLRLGPGAVLHAIVDHVVDGYAPVVDGLDKDIEEVEEQVFSDERDNPAERIYKLKREVLEFHRAAAPLLSPLEQLTERAVPLVHPDVRQYFRDVLDHLRRVTEAVDGFRDLLTSVLEANLTQVSVRQNEDMRRISAWVAIAALPTVLAGIYGMNFDHMPELRWAFGYPVVLGVMASSCLGLYWFFSRRGWL